MNRMEELIKKLEEYNYHYYVLDDPIVSDKEYDKLYDELVKLENETGTHLPYSPTQRVGGAVLDKFVKHTHLGRLWSLDKAQSFDALRDWHEKNLRFIEGYNETHSDKLPKPEYILEYKFDGLTINLTYDEGILKMGATRGTGEVGEEIYEQVLTIKSIPLRVKYKGKFEVQGEGLMPLSKLKEYNENNEVQLKNARNAAAGALRNLDVKETEKRHLITYLYNIAYIEGKEFKTQEEIVAFIKDNALPVSKYHKKFSNMEDLLKEIEVQKEERLKQDFLTDGMVIKINDVKTQKLMGYTNKFPRFAIAYKFEALETSTRIIGVEWNVGRSAKVTPTALLEPVDIGGVTIKRATLNNLDDIKRKNLHLNERVLIRRSNDVIPEIMGPLKTDEEVYEIEQPKYCPYCHSKLYKEGVHYFCPNTLGCKPQLVKTIVHFASKEAMNIDGFSEKTAELFLEKLNIDQVSMLYDLKVEDLLKLEGFKEKKANNIISSIQNSKTVELKNFIYALSIANVGVKTSRDLAEHYKTIDNFLNASFDDLVAIEDVGDITANEIVSFLTDETSKKSIQSLFDHGIKVLDVEDSGDKSLEGLKFVLTGTLENYTRDELKNILENKGAKVQGSVSSKTDYVVVGENPGSKFEKAKTLNIKILHENDLKELIWWREKILKIYVTQQDLL